MRACLLILFCLFGSFVVSSQEPLGNVDVRLSTSSGRTEFRIGEPIQFSMSFTTDAKGYSLEQYSSRPGSSHEEAVITPSTGVFDWSKQYMQGRPHNDDVSAPTDLSSTPTVVELTLNDFVRFDLPGTYTVSFRTKRIFIKNSQFNAVRAPELITNEIKLTIKEMGEADEAAETKRLSSAIDAAKGNWQEQARLARQLSFLTGQPSTIEKVKRYLAPLPDPAGNYPGEIRWGLFIAKDRKLVAKLLHDAFQDSNREVGFDLLGTLSRVRALSDISDDTSPTDAQITDIESSYITELADSLSRRKGIPRGAAAITLLQTMNREAPPPDLLTKVRSIILTDFDSYNVLSREYLLSAYWDQIKDPSLEPSIERLLKDTNYPEYGRINIQTTGIKRLIELDPQKARPFVAALIQNPDTVVFDGAIDGLNEQALPEIDRSVLEQIGKFSAARDVVRIRSRALFAARYASADIYYPLLALYERNQDSWQSDTKGILLGYFLKYDPPQGLEMLKAQAKKVEEGMRSSLFHDATRYAFPDEEAEFFEGQLMSDDPSAAGTAAYILSEHGQLKHKAMIQKRLDDWVAIWKTNAKRLEVQNLSPTDRAQVSLQVELISALVSSRKWSLSESEKRELRSRCLIQACKWYFHDDGQ